MVVKGLLVRDAGGHLVSTERGLVSAITKLCGRQPSASHALG
jgi:hypothetical protein